MTDQEVINFKLALAAAWLQQGQEDLAKSLVRSIIEERDGSQNDSL